MLLPQKKTFFYVDVLKLKYIKSKEYHMSFTTGSKFKYDQVYGS